ARPGWPAPPGRGRGPGGRPCSTGRRAAAPASAGWTRRWPPPHRRSSSCGGRPSGSLRPRWPGRRGRGTRPGRPADASFRPLVHRLVVILRPQDLARLGAVRGADDAVALHHVDEPSGPAEAHAEPALDHAGGGLAVLDHEAHGVVEELVAVVHVLGLARPFRLAHGLVVGGL